MYMNYRKKCQMSLSNRLKEIIDEIICEDGCMDEEIEEISTSSGAGHYETPYAFGKDKKKEKENSENSTGYITKTINLSKKMKLKILSKKLMVQSKK
jgi:hypothetical protein